MGELKHRPCPFCKSSDAFSFSSETGLFSCFSCQATPKTKGGMCFDGQTLTPWKDQTPTEEGLSLEPYVRNYRGISEKVLESAGVYFTKTADGKESVHYTYPHATKSRQLPKYITTQGTLDSFFGQDD